MLEIGTVIDTKERQVQAHPGTALHNSTRRGPWKGVPSGLLREPNTAATPFDNREAISVSNDGKKKLTINVSAQVADRIDEMARRRGITVTELIRRALGTQSIIDKAIEEHGDLVIIRKDTKESIHQIDSSMLGS